MTEPIGKDEAIAALRACAWAETVATCGHTGCQDHRGDGTKRIHTIRGGLGCDWDLADAEKTVQEARQVEWRDAILGHNLVAVTADGHTIRFEAQPQPDKPAVRA